jgi:tRNA threonylcarbamoyl adenosine modification protein (Sua5/YciO/YrdC/YwlC family)
MATSVITNSGTESYRAAISEAAAALRDGALVIFPTETVYGVGASAAHPEAVRRLREAKNRPDQPFTVHIGMPKAARDFVSSPSTVFRRLARRGWPGPLTLVTPVPEPEKTPLAERFDAGALEAVYFQQSVGLRCPDHAAARQLLDEAGVPIVASSANPAGMPPPESVEAALESLTGQADLAIDGGPCRLRGASTIVEVNGEGWRVLRPGVLEERIITRMTRHDVLMVCTGNSCRSPMAEYLFRQRLAEQTGVAVDALEDYGYHVQSAGTFAPVGGPISEGSLGELQARGIEAQGHRSQPLTPELVHQSDRIYAMTAEHRDMVLDLVPSAARRLELLDAEGPIADPIGGGPDAYASCGKQIEQAVNQRVEELLHEDRDW